MEKNSDYKKILLENRKNIITWYPFEENSAILELAIDEETIEINENTKIITKIEELSNEQKYDYIVIIGCIKKIEDNFYKLLEVLKENGKIIIITDNKLSIKSMCQEVETNEMYTKKELDNFLNKEKLYYSKYYYVFPNYKTANVIFTDQHLPDTDTIYRNITFYPEDTVITEDETNKMKDILEQDKNLLKIFSNSFFIECSTKEFEDNKIEFVSYSNIRKNSYKIKTIIKSDKVYKTYANEEAKQHIEQIQKNINILKNNNLKTLDTYEKNTIISIYQKNHKTLDKIIIEKIVNNDTDSALNIIEKFLNYLKQNLKKVDSNSQNVFDKYNIQYKKEQIENLTFIKDGLWDLIFQNTFYINQEFFFYDQEWYEENIPVEFILYRTIIYCKELQNIKKEEIYKLIGIKEENIEIFNELDNLLQNKTRSEIAWNVHTKNIRIQDIQNEKIQLEQNIKKISDDCTKLLNEKDARIRFLEENMEETCEFLRQKETLIIEKENIINGMKNSMSWKITRPLRKLKGLKN